ncbi:MAG: HRDC domain-containing protein [Galactobacter sp.]
MTPTFHQPSPEMLQTLKAGVVPVADPDALTRLDTPAEGIPDIVDQEWSLRRAAEALAAGTGPVAVDAERASGFRYGQRAFLVQLRREGAGTILIDPEPFEDLSIIDQALSEAEWILHAAHQDLPCLHELSMSPRALFDTELAARLAGLPRVGLGPVVETMMGLKLAKEHSAADWSSRPLPESWLNYAALDVELLIPLRELMATLLEGQGKTEIARQEFEAERLAPDPAPKQDRWRRTHGLHQLRQPVQLAAVKELWTEREQVAKHQDRAPGRLLPDSALIAAAKALPRTVPQLLKVSGFVGRAATREAPRWVAALQRARTTKELPPLHVKSSTPPPPRSWPDRHPEAAARYETARTRLDRVAAGLGMPRENLITPAVLKQVCWQPPATVDLTGVSEELTRLGLRPWQVQSCAAVLTVAFLDPDPLPSR